MTSTPDDDRPVLDDEETEVDDALRERPDEADEADVLEQHQTVPGDDDDAPREDEA